jgi:hypothetical protein
MISFLFQTGQPVNVVAGITWKMIKTIGQHGVARVPCDLKRKRRNLTNGTYGFVIGKNTMTLLDEMPDTPVRRRKRVSVFGRSTRTVERVIDKVADKEYAGVQDELDRRTGAASHRIYSRSIQAYWKDRVGEGRMKHDVSQYMLGLPSRQRYSNDQLLKEYVRVEQLLRVL